VRPGLEKPTPLGRRAEAKILIRQLKRNYILDGCVLHATPKNILIRYPSDMHTGIFYKMLVEVAKWDRWAKRELNKALERIEIS
jgi:hypothetical protein